ncbi:MAG TPA: membrane lipoprotein lipid attachment site-containing protein [Anaerolineales bacterium]|nr:membrane lipoprotein lipid attachment site-containing protein [Anaerolineales bacterium]
MKKIFLIFLLTVILASCASLPDLNEITEMLVSPTPTRADTATPRPTVTLFPTQDLFAISTATPVTFTPTQPSSAPENIATPTLIPTQTLIPLPTFSEEFINDMSSVTFFAENSGFETVMYSDGTLYWGEGSCVTRSIKITAIVEDPERTDRVFLFLRLRDKENTLNVGEWSAGAEMIKVNDGSFNYNVQTYNLRRYFYYKRAWIEYELVSVNENLEILGRTRLYDHDISLAKCGF